MQTSQGLNPSQPPRPSVEQSAASAREREERSNVLRTESSAIRSSDERRRTIVLFPGDFLPRPKPQKQPAEPKPRAAFRRTISAGRRAGGQTDAVLAGLPRASRGAGKGGKGPAVQSRGWGGP